jgi:hypothetical protein
MDDPWRNAWHDDAEQTNNGDNDGDGHGEVEVDIASAPWSTAVHINWDRQDTDKSTSASLNIWEQSTNDSFKVWQQSPTDPVPESSPSDERPSTTLSLALSPSPPPAQRDRDISPPDSPSLAPQDPSLSPSPIQHPPSSPSPIAGAAIPSSPDGFGGFESGFGSPSQSSDPWTPGLSVTTFDDEDAWKTSAWDEPQAESHTPTQEAKEEELDEWELARRRREQRDRRVVSCIVYLVPRKTYLPQAPERVKAILRQFDELAAELWPEPESRPEEPAWMSTRRPIEDFDWLCVV